MKHLDTQKFGMPDMLIRVCQYCNGDGRIFGFMTINPSEKERWHECEDCHGSGEISAEMCEEEEDEQ